MFFSKLRNFFKIQYLVISNFLWFYVPLQHSKLHLIIKLHFSCYYTVQKCYQLFVVIHRISVAKCRTIYKICLAYRRVNKTWVVYIQTYVHIFRKKKQPDISIVYNITDK